MKMALNAELVGETSEDPFHFFSLPRLLFRRII